MNLPNTQFPDLQNNPRHFDKLQHNRTGKDLPIEVEVPGESPPEIVLWIQLGGTSNNPGRMPEGMTTWDNYINLPFFQDQLAWAPNALLALHLPFGFWDESGVNMEIDAYDLAVAANASWSSAADFIAAWSPVAQDHRVAAYVGNPFHQRLTELSLADFQTTVRRNVDPFKQAGFEQVLVDAAFDAISTEYQIPPPAIPEYTGDTLLRGPNRSTDAIEVIDTIFARRTGIEIGARRFPPWVDLHSRDSWYNEYTFQDFHGSNTWLANGWGLDTSYITGDIYRIVLAANYSLDPNAVVAEARKIRSEGHIPAVQGWWLDSLGVTVEDIIGD